MGKIVKNYILKKYDNDIIDFDIVKEDYDDYKVVINSIIDKRNLPNNVFNERTLLKWLNHRSIPKNRAFVLQILKNQNIDPNNMIELINISKGLSLNDVYWIVDKDFKGTFKEYNLYENDFSEILSLIAYTGKYNDSTDSPISPEWTTSGNLPKCWRRENNELYLYKAGTSKEILMNREGYEPYSEYYISKILDDLKIEHVNYDLKDFKGKIASVCKCFCDIEYSLVPMSEIVVDNKYNSLKTFINEHGFNKDFSNMILIDALTYNGDRHYNNFGVIKNNRTNEIIKLAPIYDNGLGLFSYVSDFTICNKENMEEEVKLGEVSNWGILHSNLLLDNLSDDTYSKLIKMKDYKIQKHEKYNLSDDRLIQLNKILNNRAKELIEEINKNKNKTIDNTKPIIIQPLENYSKEEINNDNVEKNKINENDIKKDKANRNLDNEDPEH